MLLGLLALFWGLSWPALKVVLAEMAPLRFRAWCLGAGAVGLFIISALGGYTLKVPSKSWAALTVISLFNVGAWNVFVAYGVPMMDTSRAAVLAYTFPVWGVLCGMLIAGEPLTGRRVLAMVFGLAAVLLLLGSEIQAVGRSPVGAVLMLGAAISWALGTALMKCWPVPMPVLSFTAWQLAIAFVPVLLCALAFEAGDFSPFVLSPVALSGFAYLIFVCFMFCYWAWMKVATTAPVSVSSIGTLFVPVVGVFSAVILLGERPRWSDYAGLVLVIAALASLMTPAKWNPFRRMRRAAQPHAKAPDP